MAQAWRWYLPVKVHMGSGSLARLGEAAAAHGRKALLIIDGGTWKEKLLAECRSLLDRAGVAVETWDGVRPNPTTATVTEAAAAGKRAGCDVVVGVGGGSSMDTAKAAALEMTHPRGCFEYAYFQPQRPTAATLPIVLVTTTSGTGSHVSKCSVVTHAEQGVKTGIVDDHLFAREAIVDPSLMVSVPPRVTAETGFDVFTHAFESYINVNANPLIDAFAIESIAILAEALPRAVADGKDLDARTRMSIADTLAGTCIANVGTTLPHSLAQPVSGHFPSVSHGGALAYVYPPFLAFSWRGSPAKFARVARIFEPRLASASDDDAARACSEIIAAFLRRIGITERLGSVAGLEASLDVLVKEALDFPDTYVNPAVPTRDEVIALYRASQ